MNNETEKNVSLLTAFEIPSGKGEKVDEVRGRLAQLMVEQVVRLADLQTARDIAKYAEVDAPEAYLFLAAMFVSANQGNAFMRQSKAEAHCGDLGSVPWLEKLASCGLVVRESDRWYFQRDYAAVCELNETLKTLASAPQEIDGGAASDIDSAVAAASRFGAKFALNEKQREALRAAASQRFTVVTGGPGTGKTTTVCAILRALFALNPDWTARDVALAAPTGRAAQRMQEAILAQCAALPQDERIVELAPQLQGSTVHRLLGGSAPNWRHGEKNKLEKKVVVVDETSMVDLYLMQALLKALPGDARLILLGDADQLPSVDTGAVLGDLTQLGMDENVVKRLEVCERAKGEISDAARAINAADVGEASARKIVESWKSKRISFEELAAHECADAPGAGASEFRWLEIRDGVKKAEILGLYRAWMKGSRLAELAAQMPPTDAALAGARSEASDALFAELNRLRILTLVCDGWFGARQANEFLLKEAKRAARRAYADYLSLVGVPVIVTKNTPERKLFNGDVGVTVRGADGMVVVFPRGAQTVVCPVAVLPEHELAYAMTVHKSQGSEFENVMVVPPNDAAHPLLNRQIVYTGITRAKKRAVVVATEASLVAALAKKLERDTGLAIRRPHFTAETETDTIRADK